MIRSTQKFFVGVLFVTAIGGLTFVSRYGIRPDPPDESKVRAQTAHALQCTPLGQPQTASPLRPIKRFVRRDVYPRLPKIVRRVGRSLLGAVGSSRGEASVGPVINSPKMTVSVAATGFTTPTTLAFIGPDELLLIEKQTGRVQHVKNGEIVGTAFDLAVNFRHERGGLGIAVHPDFRRNRYVYIFWTWRGRGRGSAGLEGPDSGELTDVPLLGNRLDRFIWNNGSLAFDQNIARFPSQTLPGQTGGATHNGGIITFGPDGKLYAVVGDQRLRGKLQNIQDESWPADPHFSGIVVRLNDNGSIPADNPFFVAGRAIGGAAGRNIQRIFAYGVRNSFAMAFDPIGGHLWMAENGAVSFDEINRVPPGMNSGWIQIMGPPYCYEQFRKIENLVRSPDDFNPHFFPAERLAPSAPEALARLVTLPGSRYQAPAFSWKFSVAPSGLGFVDSMRFGVALRGDMLVGDLRGNLYRFELSSDRTDLLITQPELRDRVADNRRRGDLTEARLVRFGRGFGIITDIKTAPDGSLFIVSLSHGKVYRIAPR